MERKLKSRRGETLTEVLIATLVAVVALTILAAMITSSLRITEEGRRWITDYGGQNNQLENRAPDTSVAGNEISIAEGSVKFSSDESDDMALLNETPVTYYINWYANGESGTGGEVVAYGINPNENP